MDVTYCVGAAIYLCLADATSWMVDTVKKLRAAPLFLLLVCTLFRVVDVRLITTKGIRTCQVLQVCLYSTG